MNGNARFSTRPLYLQARDALVHRIVTGEWKPGYPIPNEIVLSQEMKISVGTLRRAMEVMESERIVVRKQGRGTFVNDQTSCEMAVRFSNVKNGEGFRIEGTLHCKAIDRGPPSPDEMRKLEIRANSRVIRVSRIHSYNDRPFQTEVCVLPESLYPNLPPDLGNFRIFSLAQSNQIYLGGADEKVSATMPNESDIADMMVPPTQPVLALDRIIVDIEGRPVEWRLARCYLKEKYYSAIIP